MATININARVDVSDVLDEITDAQLIREVKSRQIEDQLDIEPDDIKMTGEDAIGYLNNLPPLRTKRPLL